MRIDELDSKHKEFKEVMLNHELTEEQLDEIIPVVGAVARGVGMAAARGAGALARGAGALARGVGNVAKNVGGAINQAGQQIGQTGKDFAKKQIKSFATNTAKKLSSQGTQGTIGTDQSQGQQAKLQRGQELTIPQTDPKNPNKTIPTDMKVKNVSGREIELEPKKKQPGTPNIIKYSKKDLQLQ